MFVVQADNTATGTDTVHEEEEKKKRKDFKVILYTECSKESVPSPERAPDSFSVSIRFLVAISVILQAIY